MKIAYPLWKGMLWRLTCRIGPKMRKRHYPQIVLSALEIIRTEDVDV
ncbi:hypothetical protein CPter91_4033 [Collimonas pratensis]|uniref:Uncharacterized protein n=1 Tax=Collimonas pratensis TaxID=279113 RepID=A0A127Q8I5_9BURK|nr:hypothetical protein CPter91_4033 [Collimonas pratensis]